MEDNIRTSQVNDRVTIIQALIDAKKARNYLEIGVATGDCFFRIKCKKKMAVDPRFLFGLTDKLKWIRWNPCNIFSEYYSVPSDGFFTKYSSMLASRVLDIVFVDGLHTYNQSLRDIENSLRFLCDDGVIIVDDCNPPNELASCPSKPKMDVPWCGDVWKSIAYLRSTRSDLRTFVLDCAYGLGIIVKAPEEHVLSYTPVEIEKMSYEDFAANRDMILNLKEKDYLNSLFPSF